MDASIVDSHCVCGCSIGINARAPEIAWPQFRGPLGTGILSDGKLPTSWSTKDNVAWSVEIKGRGWSSPVAWNNTVFVTSAISPGAFKAPQTGIFGNDYAAELAKQGLSDDEVVKRVVSRDIELTAESGEIRYMVYAFDAGNGKLKWEREAHKGAPFGGRHRKNTFASETPATDGERLYAYFGNVGLFAFSLDGKPLWTARSIRSRCISTSAPPPRRSFRRPGLCRPRQRRQVVRGRLDAKTGKQIWRVERDFPSNGLMSAGRRRSSGPQTDAKRAREARWPIGTAQRACRRYASGRPARSCGGCEG